MSSYFSNGTEGDAWRAAWCDRCLNDHSMHPPDEKPPGCEVLLRAYTHDEVPEFIDNSAGEGFTLPPAVHCIMFAPCTSCDPPDGDGGPRPIPIHPDQGKLVNVEPHGLVYADWAARPELVAP